MTVCLSTKIGTNLSNKKWEKFEYQAIDENADESNNGFPKLNEFNDNYFSFDIGKVRMRLQKIVFKFKKEEEHLKVEYEYLRFYYSHNDNCWKLY